MTYFLGDRTHPTEPPPCSPPLRKEKDADKLLLNLLLLYRRKNFHLGLDSLILAASTMAFEEDAISAMQCLKKEGHYKYSVQILDGLISSLEEKESGSGSVEEIIHLLLKKFMKDGEEDFFGSFMYLTEGYKERLSAMLILKKKYNGYWKVLAKDLLEETSVKKWMN